MAKSGRRDVELVRTIFAEMACIQQDYAAGRFERASGELFCDIRHPDGRGHVPIGRAGMDALTELTLSAIKATGLSGRISETTARAELGPILIQSFSIEAQPIELTAVQKAFGQAAKRMRTHLISRVHLIPCHVIDVDDPTEIKLGPVTFLNRAAARRIILKGIPAKSDARFETEDRRLLAQAVRFYRGYRWIAAIAVDECDPDLATGYATRAVTLGLSFLQLLFGASVSQRMAIGGPPQGWAREAKLRVAKDGGLDITINHAFKSGASFEAGWSQELAEPGMQIGISLCGLALEAALPGLDRPLSERVLSAVQWYGEAVREEAPATRLIKFMTAIEHIVLTGERNGITALMAERVAALTYDIGSGQSRQRVKAEFLRLYAARSGLVHGSTSPWEPDIQSTLGAAADLAERVVHGALNCWREKGLTSPRARPRRLKQWYDRAVWMMVCETEPVAHVDLWRRQREEAA